MGNWRRAHIIGACMPEDLLKLREYLLIKDTSMENADAWEKEWSRFGPLSFTTSGSLCGLDNWLGEEINAVGNLAERDYTPESVLLMVEKLYSLAPSLDIVIHLGGDWEDKKCIATIKKVEGTYEILSPEVPIVPAVTEQESDRRMLSFIKQQSPK